MLPTDYTGYLISKDAQLKEVLKQLDSLGADAVVFIVDENKKLLGSVTDGDIRRGLIRGLDLNAAITEFMNRNSKVINKSMYSVDDIVLYKKLGLVAVPVISGDGTILNIINLRYHKSFLPVDVVIMAGGRGERLRPLTDMVPKPLLKVGDKAIIQHNIERLISYGISDFWISLRYLGSQIHSFIEDLNLPAKFNYIYEDTPLGTAGALGMIQELQHDYVLLTNSDLLTNLDYESFFLEFLKNETVLSIASIPYSIEIPYAVIETEGAIVTALSEKPKLTFQSNAGIYIMKRECLDLLPKNEFYNATDLIEKLIQMNKKVSYYSMNEYWLDIGRHEDYLKAQEDIKRILF